MTRSSATWNVLPGSFDTVNVTRGVFPAANAWGIPDLARTRGPLPRWAAPYGQRVRRTDMATGAVHFFLTITALKRCGAVRSKRSLVFAGGARP